MDLVALIDITKEMLDEARAYAKLSHDYTSRKHDFHEGGARIASEKMFEGKIGEKAFRKWLEIHDIPYEEDKSSHENADDYDFMVVGKTFDVKTRTKSFHTRTLEMVDQFYKRPKDIYVSVRYHIDRQQVELLGAISRVQLKRINRIENQGYKDNFVAFDHELSSMDKLKDYLKLLLVKK